MINTYSIESIKKEIKKIPSYTSARQYFEKHAHRELDLDDLLAAAIRPYFNNANFPISADERDARRRLSAGAWEQMYALIFDREKIKRPEGLSVFIENMLKPGSDEHNRAVLSAVEGEHFEEQAKLVGDYLKSLPAYDADEMLGLSDEELVKRFPQMYALYSAAQGAVELLGSGQADIRGHLSDESREQLKKLAADTLVFSAVMARYEMICNPRYESVNIAQMAVVTNAAAKAGLAVDYHTKLADSPYGGFFTQVRDQFQRNEQLSNREILRGLVNDGFDLSSLKIVDLKQNEYSLNSPQGLQIKSALDRQRPLVLRDGAGNIKALRPEKGKFVETNARHLVDNTLLAVMNEHLNELSELATGRQADPIWMLTGSSEYRELKAALAAHAQFAKGCSHPPKGTELDGLDESLKALREASIKYLKHKDPNIKDSTTFEEYMRGKGSGLSDREAARLKAAFTARDLSDDTRSILFLSHELGVKNTQTLAVDKTFYQGLLRKHNALEAKLEALMTHSEKGAELEARINTLLTDEKMYSSEHNPYPDDEIATLLWENRQVADLLERTETAMGLRMQDRAIDPKEKARAEASRKFGGDDPALYSVEVLQDRLNAAFAAAGRKQSTDEGPGFFATEFVVTDKLLESKIVRSNSSEEVRAYLEDPSNNLNSKEKAFLKHRIECLERIEEVASDGSYHPPETGYIATRDGKPVEVEPKFGDKIMLPGVRQRRNQNTLNGCWSVTMSTQLGYRGIKLEQERIRGYRPSKDESGATETEYTTVDAEKRIYKYSDSYYKNKKQWIHEYTALFSKVMPNTTTIGVTFGWNEANPERMETMKKDFCDAVHRALVKDNSPVSIWAGGHYLTIVGMKGDKFYVKNPMHLLGGDPETIETWTLKDLMKKGKNKLEIYWVADLKPTLGGSIEPGKEDLFRSGMFYGNGRGYGNEQDEYANPLQPGEFAMGNVTTWGRPSGPKMTIYSAIQLKYNRVPGSCYNADVLKDMEKELRAFYEPKPGASKLQVSGAVGSVLEEIRNVQENKRNQDPHDRMLDLAQSYQKAVKAVREAQLQKPSTQLQMLQNTLSRQLNQVRTAVFDAREADYKHLVGNETQYILGGNSPTRPNGMTQRDYENHRRGYTNLEEGLAGMVYFHQARTYAAEDESWIKAMRPKTATDNIAKVKNGPALQSLMEEIHDHAKSAGKYMSDSFDAQREYVSRKAGNAPKQVSEALEKKIATYKEAFSQQEAQKKLVELDAERKNRIEKAGYDSEKVTKRDFGDIMPIMQKALYLRASVRNGKTDVLFNRYLEHVNKVEAKNVADKSKEIALDKQNVKEAAANEQQAVSAPQL